MAQQILNIVQPFEKQGKRMIVGRQMSFKTPAEAGGQAERDSRRYAGVVAVQQAVDEETGEILDEPVILTRHGELPPEFADA